MGRTAYEKEIDEQLQQLKNNIPEGLKEFYYKCNNDHPKYLADNKDQIQEMQKELENSEINTQERIEKKYITGPYKKTVQQAIKNSKLKQKNLKFEDEINFTTKKLEGMHKKYKKVKMYELEPFKLIVKKEQNRINKRIIDLELLNEKQKPSISVKEAELKIFDADYFEVHDKQEAFQRDKNELFKSMYLFPRLHTRVLQSIYSM